MLLSFAVVGLWGWGWALVRGLARAIPLLLRCWFIVCWVKRRGGFLVGYESIFCVTKHILYICVTI